MPCNQAIVQVVRPFILQVPDRFLSLCLLSNGELPPPCPQKNPTNAIYEGRSMSSQVPMLATQAHGHPIFSRILASSALTVLHVIIQLFSTSSSLLSLPSCWRGSVHLMHMCTAVTLVHKLHSSSANASWQCTESLLDHAKHTLPLHGYYLERFSQRKSSDHYQSGWLQTPCPKKDYQFSNQFIIL